MLNAHPLSGVYAAALTPLNSDFSIDTASILPLLSFLAQRGCHGALLMGTTGEGPSFSQAERLGLFQAALEIRREHPGFRLLAGTGTPSLDDTIQMTRSALEMGFDGAVVLPPYYFRKAPEEGLFAWFSLVINQAVPPGSYLLGYHIPGVSGVPLPLDLLARLKDAFPDRFAGLKDSSGDPEHARQLGERFGHDLLVLNGTDRLFSLALQQGASGCITALANLCSPDLRRVWEAHLRGETDEPAQGRLNRARAVLESYPPAAPFLKALLARRFGFTHWSVRPPLLPIDPQVLETASEAMNRSDYA